MDGVEFVYALNLTRCKAAANVHACVKENNQSRNPVNTSACLNAIRLDGHGEGDHNYAPESVPEKGFFYIPVNASSAKPTLR
jgi:hypothetical protein